MAYRRFEDTRSVEAGQRTRSSLVHVPPGHGGSRPIPVILAFFGGGGSNAEQMVKFCGLNDKADKEGFLMVWLNWTDRLAMLLRSEIMQW